MQRRKSPIAQIVVINLYKLFRNYLENDDANDIPMIINLKKRYKIALLSTLFPVITQRHFCMVFFIPYYRSFIWEREFADLFNFQCDLESLKAEFIIMVKEAEKEKQENEITTKTVNDFDDEDNDSDDSDIIWEKNNSKLQKKKDVGKKSDAEKEIEDYFKDDNLIESEHDELMSDIIKNPMVFFDSPSIASRFPIIRYACLKFLIQEISSCEAESIFSKCGLRYKRSNGNVKCDKMIKCVEAKSKLKFLESL